MTKDDLIGLGFLPIPTTSPRVIMYKRFTDNSGRPVDLHVFQNYASEEWGLIRVLQVVQTELGVNLSVPYYENRVNSTKDLSLKFKELGLS